MNTPISDRPRSSRTLSLVALSGFVLGAVLVTVLAAQGAGRGGLFAEQGDGFVVALWMTWVAAFVAFYMGAARLLGQAAEAKAKVAVAEQPAEQIRRAA
jgi:uncharacterized membrane protein